MAKERCQKCGSFERRPRGNCAQCHRDAAGRRREREKAALGKHTEAEWHKKAATYPHCARCGTPWDRVLRRNGQRRPYTKGHIVALAKGGSNDISNLQPECANCNYGDHGAHFARS
ncbi:HNH endonuclease [Paracoccus endophyticus]|uniref:HNH endonuclease n=1 Tax=Paracoccus endophyticus TaxID=2233774 RepID=UPI003B835B5C